MRRLDALVGAPEHFVNLSRYMKEASENMLEFERLGRDRAGVDAGNSAKVADSP